MLNNFTLLVHGLRKMPLFYSKAKSAYELSGPLRQRLSPDSAGSTRRLGVLLLPGLVNELLVYCRVN